MSEPPGRPAALITGASSGIGEIYARRLASRGHDLALVARRQDRLDRLAGEVREAHRVRTLVVAADLARAGACIEVHRRTTEAGWTVGLLINNAGYGNYGKFAASDPERELGQIDLNVRALVELTRLYVPDMLARRDGIVVQVGSVAGFMPIPYLSTYAATKAFVLSFAEALNVELEGTGVHVMAVCPGGTRTEWQEMAGIESSHGKGMTAEQVVDLALADMDAKKRVSVTGFGNRVAAFLGGLFPRGFVARRTRALFEGRARR